MDIFIGFFIGFFIYFLFSIILHSQTSLTNLVSFYKSYKTSKLYIFISPDLYFAKQGKYILENKYDNNEVLFMPDIFNIRPSNEHKSNAIISWNSKNLIFSICSFIIISALSHIKLNNIFLYFCTTFFAYRCLSRSFEIGSAFFKDITDSKMKNPFLNSNKRIILASKSYIEIIFNFATLNLLGAIISDKFNSTY
ncbi:hypothetical protein, partial [Cetobacterium sp.]|uniref:hypothetical protein n=1 Tax=Cetobacterium sp. TaxID=2071632 RepID=UPI0025B91285